MEGALAPQWGFPLPSQMLWTGSCRTPLGLCPLPAALFPCLLNPPSRDLINRRDREPYGPTMVTLSPVRPSGTQKTKKFPEEHLRCQRAIRKQGVGGLCEGTRGTLLLPQGQSLPSQLAILLASCKPEEKKAAFSTVNTLYYFLTLVLRET